MKAFHVYINRDLHQSFKRFVWRLENDFVLRLGGVQLKLDKDQKLGINPVFYPLFSWKSKPGSKELTVYLRDISYTFLWSNGFYIFKNTDKGLEEHE
jgi:hypothetical protein